MLALEAAEQKRKDNAHSRMLEKPNTITHAAEFPPVSRKLFRHRYRVDPEFRQHVDEHQ
jgi:hypothetical protein